MGGLPLPRYRRDPEGSDISVPEAFPPRRDQFGSGCTNFSAAWFDMAQQTKCYDMGFKYMYSLRLNGINSV